MNQVRRCVSRVTLNTNPYCGAAVPPAEPLSIGPNAHYRSASLGQRHIPRLVDNPGWHAAQVPTSQRKYVKNRVSNMSDVSCPIHLRCEDRKSLCQRVCNYDQRTLNACSGYGPKGQGPVAYWLAVGNGRQKSPTWGSLG